MIEDMVDRALVYFAIGGFLGLGSMMIAYEFSLWMGFYMFIAICAIAIILALYTHYKKMPEVKKEKEKREIKCSYCGEVSDDTSKCRFCLQRR